MEYFLKKTLVKKELEKIKTGEFCKDVLRDVNRARFLADLMETYTQMQYRGVSYGLSLSMLTFYRFRFIESLPLRILMMYISKEMITVYYINDFFNILDIQDAA